MIVFGLVGDGRLEVRVGLIRHIFAELDLAQENEASAFAGSGLQDVLEKSNRLVSLLGMYHRATKSTIGCRAAVGRHCTLESSDALIVFFLAV